MTCGSADISSGLPSTSRNPPTPSSSARFSSVLNLVPTGFCIQEFAARMKIDDSMVPMAAA